MILLFATAGGLLTVLWPFFPELLPVAPSAPCIALGGWFLVISRLRTSGPDEFLDSRRGAAGRRRTAGECRPLPGLYCCRQYGSLANLGVYRFRRGTKRSSGRRVELPLVTLEK